MILLAGLLAVSVLVIMASVFAAGLVIGTGRGEQRAAAQCDIAHNRHHDRPAVLWPGDLGHYQIRPVTPNTLSLEIAAERTTVDAFAAYRDLSDRVFEPAGRHHQHV